MALETVLVIDMDNKGIDYSSANKANDNDDGEASVPAGALIWEIIIARKIVELNVI